jgi:hypothetical protein
MDARALRCLAAAAVVMASPPALAGSPSPACELPASDSDPLSDRAGILAQYERLPQACLREIFAACSTAANVSLLDFGSAAVCSFGYEALLKQGFGGNFRALMAWWQSQRGQALQ